MILLKKIPIHFTSITRELWDQSNKTGRFFPALNSRSNFLSQPLVSRRLDSSSEAKSTCWQKSDACSGKPSRKFMNTYWKKLINWIMLPILLSHNHDKLSITEKRWNMAKYSTLNFIGLEYVKKTRISNPVESLGYITPYSWSSLRPIKNSRYNYQKICSWST